MPTPEGEITTTTTWIESEEPATEEDNALAEATIKAMGIDQA